MCLEELGKHAARRLLEAIGGEPSRGLEQLPCRLVIRESAGSPPGPHAPGPARPVGEIMP
jgi:LacI family transcriptional regulator